MVKTLNKNSGTAQDYGFSKAKFQDADQNEQEIYRHGAGNSRQVYFEPRGQKSDQQVADEFSDVLAGGVGCPIEEHTGTQRHDKTYKCLGAHAGDDP